MPHALERPLEKAQMTDIAPAQSTEQKMQPHPPTLTAGERCIQRL